MEPLDLDCCAEADFKCLFIECPRRNANMNSCIDMLVSSIFNSDLVKAGAVMLKHVLSECEAQSWRACERCLLTSATVMLGIADVTVRFEVDLVGLDSAFGSFEVEDMFFYQERRKKKVCLC